MVGFIIFKHNIEMSQIYISAAHKSSGKTTVTLGLCRALRQRGLRVQPFKKGPDYIDPIWHTQAAGQPSYNLDFHMMTQAEIQDLYQLHAPQADICLIEGNKGLYDGMDLEGSNSNAALAKLLGTPVILVLDTIGMTRGIAPLLLGYQAFDKDILIAGVILNKVGGPRHEDKLRAVLEHYTDIPVLGAIHKNEQLAIRERHLGLIPGNESMETEARIDVIAEIVRDQVDLDAVLSVAAPVDGPGLNPNRFKVSKQKLRVGIARDRAFGFYYNEDIDSLCRQGVQLVTVDTLRDDTLPELDGLIIGGGFPESFIPELSRNRGLHAAIRNAAAAGMPIFAECGGLMYLSRSIRWDEASGGMVGLIPGDAVMGERPVGRGYAVLNPTGASPLSDSPGREINAHEFHHSHLENLETGLTYAYDVIRGHGMGEQRDGFVSNNVLASYCHRRGSGEHGWINPLLAKAETFAQRRQSSRMAA